MPAPSHSPRILLAGLALLAATAMLPAPATAGSAPDFTPSPGPARPVPRDVPYPGGPLTLAVDATDLDHRVLSVHETLPVAPGPLTLLFPRWLPGYHGPYGDPTRLAGLVMRAGDQRLAWQRDVLDPETVHVDIPPGAATLSIDFQNLTPLDASVARVTITPAMLDLAWETVLFYPAGYYTRGIAVDARLRLPAGWKTGTSLRDPADRLATPDGEGWWRFGTVSLETLVDSPVYAGAHARRIELDPPGAARPVALDLFGDTDAVLAASPAQLDAHRRLVQQADRLFGARHFRHYDLLMAISEQFGDIGLEHHESSENSAWSDYFRDWDKSVQGRDILPHEYTHSWNGKFRRPADLWTPNFNEPMRNSLLWVYEGQTQYWTYVLLARSGLADAPQARDAWAYVAAVAQREVGRQWRSLQDTTLEATVADDRPKDWYSWQRGADYYGEGALLWLDVDMLIRELSHDTHSLDDVARRFFGVADGRIDPLTYRFEDVVEALNAVQPYDWARLLRDRLDGVGRPAPLDGLARGGWRLVYREEESSYARDATSAGEKRDDFMDSIGLRIADKDGRITRVQWNSPAFAAGLAPGWKVLAVNMEAFKQERLAQAITANKDGQHPIELLVADGDRYRLVRLDYRGGLRYPALERIPGTPDRLTKLLSAR